MGPVPVNAVSPTTRPPAGRATAPAIPLPSAAPNNIAAAATATATAAFATGSNVCPKCLAEIKERPLFVGTYIGCLC